MERNGEEKNSSLSNESSLLHTPRFQGVNVLPDLVAKSECLNISRATWKRGTNSTGTPKTVKSFTDRQRHLDSMQNQNISEFPNDFEDKISPGLARLRMTPGRLKEKQRRLIHQHDEIRQKGDNLKSGGGVSLWPEMPQMRLTKFEVFILITQALILAAGTALLLHNLHGETSKKLKKFTTKIQQFRSSHQISLNNSSQQEFQDQVIKWHTDFLQLIDDVIGHFDMSVMSTNYHYQLYIVSYLSGLGTLFYYVLDNMLSKNKLTPSRIKKWTCLLAVIGTWTIMMTFYLHLAYRLEQQAIACVQDYSSSLAHLVIKSLNLDVYHAVLLYWRARFLDSASQALSFLCNKAGNSWLSVDLTSRKKVERSSYFLAMIFVISVISIVFLTWISASAISIIS